MSHPGPETDLEYDLAHEAHGLSAPDEGPAEHVVVTSPLADADGDYGYDLAHDMPH